MKGSGADARPRTPAAGYPAAAGDVRKSPAAGARHPGRERRAKTMRRLLHIAVSVLLWVVFVYYWDLVSRQTIGRGTLLAIQVLSVAVVGGTIVTLWWIAHNLRLGRRNRRRAPRPAPPETFERDVLGRPLRGPELAELKRAAEVTVAIEGGAKVYAVASAPPTAGG